MTLRTIVVTAIILLASGSAHAQSGRPDLRWQPYLGCWMPIASDRAPIPAAAARPVCIVPADGKSAADIVTSSDGRVASREHIDASGDRRTTDKDSCATTDVADWSADGRRVYIKSDSGCANGVKRTSSRLLAMSPRGEFLDVDAMTLGATTGVRVLTYRSTSVPRSAPADIAAALDKISSGDTARLVASSPVTTADVAEASHALGGSVVQAWLTAIGQPFTLDAKRLVQLADAGVPDNVIDVMVALSYPSAFAVKPSTTFVGSLGSFGSVGSYGTFDDPTIFGDVWYGYFPYSYYSYGYYPYGYSPYQYSPYGYGGYGDYYFGSSPVVITRNPGAGDGDKPHGQVVNGRGYSSGSSSSEGSGSSSGSSGASSSGGSVGASSGGGRTAQPR